MNGRIFIDSNILVYSIDESEPKKQSVANKIIWQLAEDGGTISTQVLQEFYNISTKKLGLSKEQAKELIERLADCFTVHKNSVADILRAVEISIKTQFSFWDSLIISAAIAEGCTMLYSEDLNNGQVVDGVKIENPFI